MRYCFAAVARLSVLTVILAATSAPLVRAQEATPVADVALAEQLAGIATETAEIRDLEPLPDIDDVILTRDQLVERLPGMITEELEKVESWIKVN